MIVTSCPLRVSLVGGSTDHPRFIERYGHGSVISFPSSLRTYVSVHQDVFGTNSIDHNYNINYSKRETVKRIDEIQNELVRYCFEYLDVRQINCTLTSDIYSVGSGLAASSAYLQALIKSIYVMREKSISGFEVCKIAEQIERRLNPLVGQQDFYGSLGGFKRINFFKDRDPEVIFLSTKVFNDMDMHLIYTGVLRNSTSVLESLDIEKSVTMLDDVIQLEQAINQTDITWFNEIINKSWATKKNTSVLICENPVLSSMDDLLSKDKQVLSHKLCGAGNGGYFLVFTRSGANLSTSYPHLTIKQISISETGLKYIQL